MEALDPRNRTELYHVAVKDKFASWWLRGTPRVAGPVAARLREDFERLRYGLPPRLREYCLERYQVDIAGRYAGTPISVPFGKASGQLSLNAAQVRRDAEAGLGFIVLKTAIGESPGGTRTMGEWAIPETRMRVERISGAPGPLWPDSHPPDGWTVTWKGRGWPDTLARYAAFLESALEAAATGAGSAESVPVVAPSLKLHLPVAPDEPAHREEYAHSLGSLVEAWRRHLPLPMPVEKDFSPTLAGDWRSTEKERVLRWLRETPDLLVESVPPGSIRPGIKLMNAAADLEFQVEMMRAVTAGPSTPPAFLVYANRLFDPDREFEGVRGAASGGPDLALRNLAALAMASRERERGTMPPLPEVSATGDIQSGRRACEYALLGATSCQMHTLFQLPDGEFAARMRNKSAAVLHHLVFHPESGLLAWLLHFSAQLGSTVHWLDLPALGCQHTAFELSAA